MFIDEATIEVRAGRGGDGCVSFRREKFVPKGGPDGGDGGRGGDVVFLVDPHMRTLLPFRHQREYAAENGKPGMGKQMFGRDGEDCVIRVPRGTVVQGVPKGDVVADLVEPGQRVVLLKGGKGGKGNVHFKSPTRRAPRFATNGHEGEEYQFHLTLKLLADVGLVGLPNVGKSTLMKRISNATPKVGDFHFTTIRPNLGIVGLPDFRSLVMADLPGLIEGASEGKGLGHRFLRHVERTRVLLFLIDSASEDPEKDLDVLRNELSSFRSQLLSRPSILCYSRADLTTGRSLPMLEDEEPLRLSSHTGEGIESLLQRLSAVLQEVEAREGIAPIPSDVDREMEENSPESAAGHEDDADRETAMALTSFADRVEEGEPLGRHPWPRAYFVETPGVSEE